MLQFCCCCADHHLKFHIPLSRTLRWGHYWSRWISDFLFSYRKVCYIGQWKIIHVHHILEYDICCVCIHHYSTPERPKKLITSSEWHSLISTASKWFIFGHRLGKFILNKHIWKKLKFTSMKEEINAMKSQEVNFQKSQKLLASQAG